MKIKLHQHPFGGAPAQEFQAESLALWLLERYGPVPKVQVHVYAGEPSADTEITGDVEATMRGDAPTYTVLESPGGPIVPIIGNLILSMVISAAVNAIFAPDKIQRLDNRTQQSPNNQLANRENRVRMMERVEDIFGTVRSIPSLMMPTYTKYIENQKVEYGYYCVGRGYCDVTDVRDGDTPLTAITGACAAVYWPFTSPNSGSPVVTIGDAIIDEILTAARSNSVDAIVLKPMNQLQLQSGLGYYFIGAGFPGVADTIPENASAFDMVHQPERWRRPNFAAIAEVGQTLTISMSPQPVTRAIDSPRTVGVDAAAKKFYVDGGSAGFWNGAAIGEDVTVAGMGSPYDGTYTIASFNATELVVVESLGGVDLAPVSAVTFSLTINQSGTRTISEVGNGYVLLSGASVFSPISPDAISGNFLGAPSADLAVNNSLSDWTDWYTLSDSDRTEVWTNVLAQNGMYKDDGSKQSATVAYEVEIEQLTPLLVPTGTVETVSGSITGATSNERAETLERVTGWTGAARVRARRTTPFDYDFAGLVSDEITWVDLYSVTPVSAGTHPHFGNKTTIHTITQATSRAAAVSQRQLNCRASRLLPTYNGTSFSGVFNAEGFLTSGDIYATSKIVDIMAAVTIDPQIGNRSIDDLDLDQVWGVQQALDAWNTECGEFNYTFDSDQVSFEETLNAIANAAFCVAYRQNGKIRLALDRPQSGAVALFTHRNKRPDAETITRKFASDSEYDGVEFAYIDPDTETQETIRLPADGSFTKLKKIEIPGIRNYEQAWLRASRELARLKFQRISIETDTTSDARALLPNSRVLIVDNTRIKSYDGEVVNQDGLEITLSRDVEFIPATPHSIVLMKRDGSLQSVACTAGSAPNKVVMAAPPAEPIVILSRPDVGIRTIFSFAADSARDAQAYLVQEIGISDGQYIQLRAINYADEYYSADDDVIPDKSGVIYI